MLKYIVPAGLVFLLMACGQQAAEKKAAIAKDTLLNQEIVIYKTDSIPEEYKKDNPDSYKSIKGQLPKSIASFIPPGYIAMDTCSGDLNLDAYPDMLLVLRLNEEDSLSKNSDSTVKRRLMILAAKGDGSYKLAAQSDNAVYCYTCGGAMGDPYMGLVIKNGYFSIEHYGGAAERWEQTITFKYAPADSSWYLHKDGYTTFEAGSEDGNEKKKTKILTVKNFGKVPFEQYDVYK